MIERYPHKSLTWYDVVNPTSEEIRELMQECRLPAAFLGDLTTMTPLTEAHSTKQALKVTLDFPIVKRTDISHPHEIKFIATKKCLITIRFEDIAAVHRFAKEFEVLSILSNGTRELSGGVLFISLLTSLYDAMHKKLDYLEGCLHDIEEGIFTEHEKEMVFEISKLTRRLLSFRQTIGQHTRVLNELPDHLETAFGKTMVKHLGQVRDSQAHLLDRVESVQRTVDDLRDTNFALLTTKQNEIMKTLTILAFVTFPLTLFTSTFGMNTEATPIIGNPHDFWIIIGVMALISGCFFIYFRYKRWM